MIEQRVDRDADGHDESYSVWHYDATGARIERITHDLGSDGTIDIEVVYIYDLGGDLIAIATDEGADGVTDSTQHFEYRVDGLLIRSWLEDNATGRTSDVTMFDRFQDGRIERIRVDRDGDTEVDAVSALYWHAGLHIRTDIDDPLDGTVDSTVSFRHDDAGRVIRRDTTSAVSAPSIERFEYTATGKLASYSVARRGMLEAADAYEYDAVGRIETRRSTRLHAPATDERFRYFGCADNPAPVFWPKAPGPEGVPPSGG